MKSYSAELFNEMKRTSSSIVTAWKIIRTDGLTLGFTSGDTQFTYDGLSYEPTDGFSVSATQAKGGLAVDNTTLTALLGLRVNVHDLLGGLWDTATVDIFWISPRNPQWGILPIQSGMLGEVTVKNTQYEVELRSYAQQLQQSSGRKYLLECDTNFASPKCGVGNTASAWTANTDVSASVTGDATFATIVQPSTPNGFWYMCVDGANTATTTDDTSGWSAGLKQALIRWFALYGSLPPKAGGYGTVNDDIASEPGVSFHWGTTYSSEPDWPAALGSTVNDGSVVWKAITPRSWPGTVRGVSNRATFVVNGLSAFSLGYFQYGFVLWTSGKNAGLSMEIRKHSLPNGIVTFDLAEAMPFTVAVGDTFTAHVGCPKTREACLAFGNIYNMQAFPDMPIEDMALSTPNYSSQGS